MPFDYYWNLGLEMAGSTLAAIIGLVLFVGALYWQYREYRRWPHDRRVYLVLKIGAPLGFVLLGLVASGVAGMVEGMEALGVFYLGMIFAMFAAPVCAAMIAPILGVPFKDGLSAAVSLFLILLTVVYGLSMFVNAGGSLVNRDLEYERREYGRQHALEHPEPAGDRVKVHDRGRFRLPDGSEIHSLAFEVAQGWFVKQALIVSEAGQFSTFRSFCSDGMMLHDYEILTKGMQATLKMRWYQKDQPEGPFIGVDHELNASGVVRGYLQLFEHRGQFTLPIAIPIQQISLINETDETPMQQVLNIKPAKHNARFEEAGCMPLETMLPAMTTLAFRLHANTQRTEAHFQLQPRHVAPEFRE